MGYENAATKSLMQQLRFYGGVELLTLSGTLTLTAKSANFLFLDPGGSARNVDLPAEEESNGLFFFVVNEADAAENLVVRNDAGSTICTLNQSEWGIVACDGETWRDIPFSALSDYLGTSNTWTAAQAVNAALTTTRGVASGTALKVGGLAYASTAASTAITGAQEAETNFDTSYTLPANSLTAGTIVRIRGYGVHTAETGTESHTILLKIGSITIAQRATVNPSVNDGFWFDATVVCRAAGGSGSIIASGWMAQGGSGTATMNPFALGATTIDTTAAHVIAVAIDRQAGATDSDSARLDILHVEVLG